jgi:hypothetical protein
MSEPLSEDTKRLLGHILYRVKQMIHALIEDGDWLSVMPSDNAIARTLTDLIDEGYSDAATIEELALDRLTEQPQEA